VNDHSSEPQCLDASRWVRRQLVKSRFQLKFSLAVFSLMTLFMVISWYFGNHYVNHLASSGLIEKGEVATHMQVMVHVIVRNSILSWILVFGLALLFSHFVASPIYRFEQIMRKVQMGDVSHRVTMRPYDELQTLAQEINGALEQIRSRAGLEISRRKRLGIELERLSGLARSAGVVDGMKETERLLLEEKNHPSLFKLPPEVE
jgi:HAMP domain-containing protein